MVLNNLLADQLKGHSLMVTNMSLGPRGKCLKTHEQHCSRQGLLLGLWITRNSSVWKLSD